MSIIQKKYDIIFGMEQNPKAPATPRESATEYLRELAKRAEIALWDAERYGVAYTSVLKNWREIAEEISEAMLDIASAEFAEDEAEESAE